MDEDRPTEATPPPAPAPAGSIPPKGLIERVKDILITPKTEWDVIEREASSVQGIYTRYVVILAAIAPIAMLIGEIVFLKLPVGYVVTQTIVFFPLSLAAVYVTALVIDALAPTFKGVKNFMNAFKVAAYSQTAAWIVGVFWIVPRLAFLMILGLYSLYLLYLGLPKLMKVKEDQAIGYVGVVIFVQLILYALVMTIMWQVAAAFFQPVIVISPGVVTYS